MMLVKGSSKIWLRGSGEPWIDDCDDGAVVLNLNAMRKGGVYQIRFSSRDQVAEFADKVANALQNYDLEILEAKKMSEE